MTQHAVPGGGGLLAVVKGAGDLATGCAYRLHRAGFRVVCTEISDPLVVRRTVAFAEAVRQGTATVEGVTARLAATPEEAEAITRQGDVAVLVDPAAAVVAAVRPAVLVDAIIAKRNLGTARDQAPAVIGVGPGFTAGEDVDAVVESNRGHDLGRVLWEGQAEPDTGVPGPIAGVTSARLLRAAADGAFRPVREIGDRVEEGEVVAWSGDAPVRAGTSGVLRGLLAPGMTVRAGLKVGDVDPRAEPRHCLTISDKARAIGGGVVEAALVLLAGQGVPGRT